MESARGLRNTPRKSLLAIVACSIALSGAPLKAAPTGSFDATRLSPALNGLLPGRAPGVAVAIVHDGRVVLSKGFGTASVEAEVPVTPDTLFRAAFVSTTLVTLGLLSLADRGKLDLHAPIGRYVDGLGPKLSKVTTHQLLTQTSGLSNDHPAEPVLSGAGLRQEIGSWGDDLFIAEPGQLSSISNRNAQVAGLIFQAISGKPFAQAMSESVLRELGMDRTTYDPSFAMTYPLAQGHVRKTETDPLAVVRPFNFGVFGWPRSDVFSNASDLSRLMRALLGQGMLEGRRVISASVIQRFFAPVTVNDGKPGVYRHISYGGSHEDYRGVRLSTKNSSWWGSSGLMQLAPDHGFGIVVVANASGSWGPTAERVKEIMLPLSAKVMPVSSPTVPLAKTQALSLTGLYENERTVSLEVRDGHLWSREVRTRANQLRASKDIAGVVGAFTDYDVDLPMFGSGDDQLVITKRDKSKVPVEIIRDRSGTVSHIRIEGRALKRRAR